MKLKLLPKTSLTAGIFFNFSVSCFCICKALLAFAKASRDRLPLFPETEIDAPSVLDFPGTPSDLIILTPSFSLVVVKDTLDGMESLLKVKTFVTSSNGLCFSRDTACCKNKYKHCYSWMQKKFKLSENIEN